MTLLKQGNHNYLRLIHALGTSEEKERLYSNGNCPEDIINDVIDSFNGTNLNPFQGFMQSVLTNPCTTKEQLLKIENSPVRLYKDLAQNHPNHPNFHNVIGKRIDDQCLLKLKTFIKDDDFFNEIINGAILAGTSVSNLTRNIMNFTDKTNDGVKDWDIYFYKKESLENSISLLLNKFVPDASSKIFWETISPLSLNYNEVGAEFVQLREFGSLTGTLSCDSNYRMVITNNAISIQDKDGTYPGYQFILTIHNENPEEIVNKFDYLHCSSFFEFSSKKHFTTHDINYAIFNKQLIFKGGLNPLSSMIRMKKFGHRGWRISQLQLLKILAFSSETIDFNNPHMVQSLLRGFYLESKYPELMNMPVDDIKSISELMEYLDKVTFANDENGEHEE